MPKKVKDGTMWGDWHLDAKQLKLVLQSGRHHNGIYLEEITDGDHMLSKIFHFRHKVWVTNEMMGDLLSAFQDLFDPYTTFCQSKTINATEHLRAVIAKR